MTNLNADYRNLDCSARALRRFGFTVGIALLGLGTLLVWRQRGAGWPFVAVSVIILLVALVQPARLRLFHRGWMTAALAMGWMMTRVILTVVFILVVTPIGLLQRLSRKRALDLAFRTGAESYWEARSAGRQSADDYEKQF